MKLEQTIQRSKKSQSGIIGQTQQNNYVTEWELVYHKILNISNLFHGITSSKLSFRETDLHHELGGSISTLLNESTRKVTTFLAERGNPYLVTSSRITKLHHFMAGQCVNKNDANRIISIIEDGNKQYVKFRGERFVKKETKLFDAVKKKILPSFELGQKSVNKTSINIKKILRTQGEIKQNFGIACSRCFTIKNILTFDLGCSSFLFDGNLTFKPEKHLLVTEIEKYLMEDDYDFSKSSQLETALIVDFISNVRNISATQCQIFKDILVRLWSIIYNSCTFQRFDIIYDSYIEQSIKFSERQRWAITNGILVCNIECSSYIPSQMEKFWACDRNKENLQLISRSFFIENASENSKCLTFSGIISDSDAMVFNAFNTKMA